MCWAVGPRGRLAVGLFVDQRHSEALAIGQGRSAVELR
jgi:hypothetical protein